MNTDTPERIDEVSKAYEPAGKIDTFCGWVFYVLVALSLLVLFPDQYPKAVLLGMKTAFLVLSVLLFSLFILSKVYFIPVAERVRRKQLLADAFGVVLTPEKTQGYYNNGFDPSHQRLAANVMENAFFGKEVAGRMLVYVRLKTGVYFLLWLALVSYRHESMDIVLWITQMVFSADIFAYWLSLEMLRVRHERVYDDLYQHFLHKHGEDSPTTSASILDAFAAYESAKASAGVLLDSKVFFQVNPELSKEWNGVREKLQFPS